MVDTGVEVVLDEPELEADWDAALAAATAAAASGESGWLATVTPDMLVAELAVSARGRWW